MISYFSPFFPPFYFYFFSAFIKPLNLDAFAASPGEAPATLEGAAAPPTPTPVAAALDACSGNGGFHVCQRSACLALTTFLLMLFQAVSLFSIYIQYIKLKYVRLKNPVHRICQCYDLYS